MAEKARRLKPDLIIGSSQGSDMAQGLKVPLIRVGFPINDRVGGTRVLDVGYKGIQQMFDAIVNCMIQAQQKTL